MLLTLINQKYKYFTNNISIADLLVKVKSTGIYLLVPIVNFGVSIVTTPIFAKHLSASEFGIFGYFASLSTFIGCFYGLLFQTYYMSAYFRESADKRKQILVTLLLFNILWNVFFFPISYFGLLFYFKITGLSMPFYPYALLTLGAAVLGGYKGFVQVNYRLGEKPFPFFLIVSGYRVLSIIASLYFVVFAEMGLKGRLLGVVLVEILFFVISLSHILKKQEIRIDKEVLKHAFKIVLPLFPASFLYLPLGSFDNIVLARMDQPSEMGLYNIGKGIATYMYVALFPFYQTFEPNIYKNIVNKNIKALKSTGLILLLIVSISVIAFWLVAPMIIDFLTAGKYHGAVKYANILAITNGLMIIFSFFDAIINALQATKKHLLINSIIAVVCVCSYTLGGSYFGQIGVAYATVGTFVVLILLQAGFVIRKFKRSVAAF